MWSSLSDFLSVMRIFSPVMLVLVLLGAYLVGFAAIRFECQQTTGPLASGPGILMGPDWYRSTRVGGLLSEIYWPMFWLEQKVTGEQMCFELTERLND